LVVPADGWHIGTFNLRWPTLAKALDLQQDTIITQDSVLVADIIAEETEIDEDAAPAPVTEKPTAPVAAIPPVPTPDTPAIDPRQYLRAFYDALPTARNRQVRVVHYGDSQIEEDRITMVLRERLQDQYGGGGVGLIPLHQTIPTRSLHQSLEMNGTFQTPQGGPKRYIVYGPKSMRLTTGDYGVMGQVAVMDDSVCAGSEDLRLITEPMDNGHSYNYFSRVRLLSRGVKAQVRPRRGGTYTLFNNGIATLPDSTTRCEIRLQGKGMVYGLSLETPTGIIVDNIPMRGSSGTVFTQIQRSELTDFFEDTNTRLIIMQYGGNMIPQTENPSTISGYVKSLRRQVAYLRQCAPHAAILHVFACHDPHRSVCVQTHQWRDDHQPAHSLHGPPPRPHGARRAYRLLEHLPGHGRAQQHARVATARTCWARLYPFHTPRSRQNRRHAGRLASGNT